MEKMKNYRLAVDENGSPFVLNSKGSIDFGYITEEMNLPPAPIRIAEGNDNYGLTHIELRHGSQLRENGFISAHEFVDKLIKDLGYWKVISGGVFNLRYSKKKKEIYSGSDNRPPQPAPDGEGFSLSKM